MCASMGFPKKLSLDYWWWEVLLLNHPQISTSSSLSPNSWLKIDAPPPRPKTPILWLRCVDCSPSQGSTLWYRDFYPPQYHLFGDASIWGSVFPSRWDFPRGTPYLLGQIGLVGNLTASLTKASVGTLPLPYLLGQIGLVGNVSYHFSLNSCGSLTY